MKKVNLNELDMVELNFNEMQSTDGGTWAEFTTWCSETWSEVKQSFSSGFSNGATGADKTK